MHAQLSPQMRECIELCLDTYQLDVETTTHCLELGGKHAAPHHIQLLLDCADACRAAAAFMLRTSELHAEFCRTCADACVRCAQSCESMPGDELMERCAQKCRDCADSCLRMAEANALSTAAE